MPLKLTFKHRDQRKLVRYIQSCKRKIITELCIEIKGFGG